MHSYIHTYMYIYIYIYIYVYVHECILMLNTITGCRRRRHHRAALPIIVKCISYFEYYYRLNITIVIHITIDIGTIGRRSLSL